MNGWARARLIRMKTMIDPGAIPDIDQRRRALDLEQSFIVQAPAGSGKTALLIQRYLRLLTGVDAPEEIVAITFTRKAAAEMRTRVLAALEAGKLADNPADAYEQLNRELAQAVLQRDRRMDWYIAENPERLRIQTIDSLCAALTRQMPVLSKFGAQPEIVDDASDFYREAARETLSLLDCSQAIARDVERLLEHLDNDSARFEDLLAEMLARRDHWLRHIHNRPRDELEAALQRSRQHALSKVLQSFPVMLENELLALLHYAAMNLAVESEVSDIVSCESLVSLTAADVAHWRGVAELLLTDKGTWRKQAKAVIGFPPGNAKAEKERSDAWKQRLRLLINALESEDDFRLALQDVRRLPPSNYTDSQWEILGAITRLLPYAVAQLNVIFQANGVVDFSEIAQRALQALGDSEAPTDLALALDYRIKHLMIDEFQDTSISQFRLLEKLTSGWVTGDGRTLFIVGDPMQSIYRFREAEVGLFLQARDQGIGDLTLQSITLRANFRSQQGIVDWVNAAFAQMLPQHEDRTAGAVAYAPSIAIHPKLSDAAVAVYPFFAKDSVSEARQVVAIIQQAHCEQPAGTIAVLVRSRNHLTEIVAQIKAAGLRFRAIEIEWLQHKPVVQDLLIMTRALINPADRLAWIALLRAPGCGLLLGDIAALMQCNVATDKQRTIWDMICDENCWLDMSTDAQMRLHRIVAALKPCMAHRQRQSLRLTVEAVWQVLGGAHASSASHLADAMIYLNYLESKEQAWDVFDLANFEQGLNALYASPDLEADDSLQIMTIHKAKGLEFDTVIVPGLGRAQRNHGKQLLKWIEQPNDRAATHAHTSVADLMLAPIQATGADVDSIYRWLEKLDRDKERFEADRLLYVAATRAKRKLHLLGHTGLSDSDGKNQPKEPASESLLRRLWPIVRFHYGGAVAAFAPTQSKAIENENNSIDARICRLQTDWVLPDAPHSVMWQGLEESKRNIEEIEFSWVGEMTRHVGTVVHRWLQRIADDELRDWTEQRILAMRDQFKQNLFMLGVTGDQEEVAYAIQRIVRALIYAVSDRRGRWILGVQSEAQNELKVTGVIDGSVTNCVIDRTFCDANGVRWIIDYKTSSHEGSDSEGFLDREQVRYRYQLNQYAALMREIDHRPIKLGLYFPLIGGWREW